MTISRRNFHTGFASLIGATFVSLTGVGPSFAQNPSSGQIINLLAPPPKTRSITDPPLTAEQRAKIEEQKRFLEGVRTRSLTRAISVEERNKVEEIAREKPQINLQINFEFNSAEIGPQAQDALIQLGTALRDPRLKDATVLIAGHTDAKGSDGYNQELSERRAASVKRFLAEKFGIQAANLISVGFGKARLKNTTDPLAAENRRVQVVNLTAQ